MRMRRSFFNTTLRAMLGRALALIVALFSAPCIVAAQNSNLPFQIGESLEYQVSMGRLGNVGEGRMWVEGPVDERGVRTWLLRFVVEAGRGPIRGRDNTSSWLDPRSFSITRFEKEERHPLSRSREVVEIKADSGLWRDAEGPSGKLASASPLDELSFMYFLRTLPLGRDTTMVFDRHFDAERNPTIVRVAGTFEVETPAGIFRTRLVEMEVRDPKRYKGTGTIRIHMNEGDCKVPVRIESQMPVFGRTILVLKGWSHAPGYPGAIIC